MGDLHPAHATDHQAAAPHPETIPVHAVPELVDLRGVLPEKNGGEDLVNRDDGRVEVAEGEALAHPGDSLVGPEDQDDAPGGQR